MQKCIKLRVRYFGNNKLLLVIGLVKLLSGQPTHAQSIINPHNIVQHSSLLNSYQLSQTGAICQYYIQCDTCMHRSSKIHEFQYLYQQSTHTDLHTISIYMLQISCCTRNIHTLNTEYWIVNTLTHICTNFVVNFSQYLQFQLISVNAHLESRLRCRTASAKYSECRLDWSTE